MSRESEWRVGNYTLTGKSTTDIKNQSVVFIGNGGDSITIMTANIDNGTYSSGYDESTKNVFAVEGCTVTIDGLEINDLGMNLTIGTMYGVGNAELVLTNGASSRRERL